MSCSISYGWYLNKNNYIKDYTYIYKFYPKYYFRIIIYNFHTMFLKPQKNTIIVRYLSKLKYQPKET